MNNITMNATSEKMRFLKKSFAISAIGFLAVCFIGYMASLYIDSTGIVKDAINNEKFKMGMYSELSNSTTAALTKLSRVSVGAMGLILISSILNIVWAFRALRASKSFIYTVFTIYIIAQGLGFGILFSTWNARDLMAVFGISGGIFLFMAIIGYTSKNLMPLGRWLFIGSIAAMGIGLLVMILSWTGVYHDKVNTYLWAFFGLLTIGWIAFDIWMIKRTAQFAEAMGGLDEEMEFRLTMWFGFRLLSDMISLIWTVARFYSRNR